MAVTIKAGGNKPERRVVAIEGLDGCTLTVREPTNRERLAQWLYAGEVAPRDGKGEINSVEWESALWEYRLCVVCDWSGFQTEDGGPLMFSPSWLWAAMRQNPALENAAVKAANAAFYGITDAEEKNSQSPPVAG